MCMFEVSKQHKKDGNPCIVPEDKREYWHLDLNLVNKEEDEKEKERDGETLIKNWALSSDLGVHSQEKLNFAHCTVPAP